MPFSKVLVSFVLAVSLGLPGLSQAQPPTREERAIAASLTPAQQEAAKLLLYSVVLSGQMGEMVDIPRDIQNRYNSIAKTVGFSIPGGVVAVGTLYSFRQSLNEFKSVLDWVNVLLKFSAKYLARAATLSLQASERIGLNLLLDSSSTASGKVWDAVVMPVLKISSKQGIMYSVGTLAGVGSLAGSSYLIFNGPESALSYESARSLFGYNKALENQIDIRVAELTHIYSLKPAEIVALKDAIREAVVEKAIENKFRRDASYHIDLIEVLGKKQLITVDERNAAALLASVIRTSTSASPDADDAKRLGDSVSVILATQALLETMIESGKLSNDSEMRARQMLANSQRLVRRIRQNIGG